MPKQMRKFTEELKVPEFSTLVVISGELNVLYVVLACTACSCQTQQQTKGFYKLRAVRGENSSATQRDYSSLNHVRVTVVAAAKGVLTFHIIVNHNGYRSMTFTSDLIDQHTQIPTQLEKCHVPAL